MKHRALMIGVGGWAEVWIRSLLPSFAERCELAALIDIDPDVLKSQGEAVGLWPAHSFGTLSAGLEAVRSGSVEADCAFVVIPPEHHREAVVGCLEAGLDVLCEKPLAASWNDCLRIRDAVHRSLRRVAVMQNYRHAPAMREASRLIADRLLGEPYFVSVRFRADYRAFGSWAGPRRHQMARPVLEDAAVHHLDQVRHLTGQDFEAIACEEWRPPFADGFAGTCCVTMLGRLIGGVKVVYEANVVCASEQFSWTGEEYRVECAEGAVVVRGDDLTIERLSDGQLKVEKVTPPPMDRIYHPAAIQEFLDWLDGGTPPATLVADNLNSVAAVLAATRAADESAWVKVEPSSSGNGR